ncbi:hypothetical protein KW453_15935 [Vibrio fluvialis]|nr:hypothetical protein [Vibrio fluvialis]MBY7979260.1 hypothetical protein [Vibrio fluvialis]
MELLDQITQEVTQGKVTKYNDIDARLAELRATYGSEVPDASTKDGYQRAKDISKEMTTLRTSLESRRKDFKAPVLAFGKMIDSEAKRLTSEILAIEEPFKAAYRAVDEEKKRVKEEIEARFTWIVGLVVSAKESDSSSIEKMIEDLAEYDVSKEMFGRRVDEAAQLVASTLESLTQVHVSTLEKEAEDRRIEAERLELEALRREKEERERAELEEQNRIKHEEELRIAGEKAAEQARKEAEEKAKIEAERHELEKAEAEQRAIKAENDRIAAEQKAKRDAEEAAERARLAEIERQKREEQAKREEQERLEANKRHCAKIHNAAASAIVEQTGISEELAKKVITVIAQKKVPNILITY